MTRYHHLEWAYNGEVQHAYTAVGEKPVGSYEGQYGPEPTYPSAHISITHKKAKATPNFNFEKDHVTKVRENLREGTHPLQSAELSYGSSGIEKINKDVNYPNLHENIPYDRNSVIGQKYADTLQAYNDFNLATPDATRFRRKTGLRYAQGIRDLRNATSQLFTAEPESAEITNAFSHRSMRHHIPILAAYDHMTQGIPFTPSNSLSQHSSKLTKNAQEMGFPVVKNKDNPKANVTNDVTFRDLDNVRYGSTGPVGAEEEIPSSKMNEAKQHFRTLRSVGRATPKPLSQQFSQPRFPGMEE